MLLIRNDISYTLVYDHHGTGIQRGVSLGYLSICKQNFSLRGKLYRQPGGTSEDFQLFRNQLDHIRNQHKSKPKLPSVHVIGTCCFTRQT